MNEKDDPLKTFFRELPGAARKILLLDYDGTLAPFRVERDQAVPYPGIREILTRIEDSDNCRLVIISGRGVKDVRPLLGLEPPPEIWGCHGWERLLPDERLLPPELPVAAQQGLIAARTWSEQLGLGERLEVKPASVAVHWRGLTEDEISALRDKVTVAWQEVIVGSALELHHFDGGLELRCPGRDKGFAVRTVLAEEPSGTTVAYLGDDLTDEDAFKALQGHGLGVLVRQEARPTAASLRITPPEELLDFLRRWADACEENMHHG